MYEVIIGWAIVAVAQVAKKFKIDQKYVITWLAIVWAVGYTIYQQYLPEEVQQNMVATITQISWSATIIYNAIKIAFEQSKK